MDARKDPLHAETLVQKCKHLIAGGLFIILTVFLILGLTALMTPKFYYDEMFGTTTTFHGFYEMKPDTVDVIFLGSSCCAAGFVPQEIYDSAGIRSYNLASGLQSIPISCWWLEEALRSQTPKAVVLDCTFLFEYNKTLLNSGEEQLRKAIDPMRWSAHKRQVVKEILALDPDQSELSYYFPLIRFHERTTNLGPNDFHISSMQDHYELKGYAPSVEPIEELSDYEPYDPDPSEGFWDTVPKMQEYLDRITELCQANGIRLILVNVPGSSHNREHNTIAEYADRNDLLYVDFNERSVYEKIGYDFNNDMSDGLHPNVLGAQKLSAYMGSVLRSEGIPPVQDEQWDTTSVYYASMLKDAALVRETDTDIYLPMLADSRYTLFLAVQDNVADFITDAFQEKLFSLGIETDLRTLQDESYYAIVSQDRVEELHSMSALSRQGMLFNESHRYYLYSAGRNAGISCSFMLDNHEYIVPGNGLHIVVFDNFRGTIVDSVRYTANESISLLRFDQNAP